MFISTSLTAATGCATIYYDSGVTIRVHSSSCCYCNSTADHGSNYGYAEPISVGHYSSHRPAKKTTFWREFLDSQLYAAVWRPPPSRKRELKLHDAAPPQQAWHRSLRAFSSR